MAVIYPCPGELGWLSFNFVPHVQYLLAQEDKPFDHVVAYVREGYEALYSFADVIETFNYFPDKTEGNAFVLHSPDAYDFYKAHCFRIAERTKELRKAGHEVVEIRLPLKEYRYHRYKMRHRDFKILTPSKELVSKWTGRIASSAVIFHIRNISRSIKKNTPVHLYDLAVKWAKQNGRQVVTVGKTHGYPLKINPQGLDLINQTSIADLISIFHLGGMVVGSSSGPMHLAALTGTPSVVWGGGRNDVRNRYLKEWNPFGTLVDHISLGFDTKDDKLQMALTRMSKSPQSNAARRDRYVDVVDGEVVPRQFNKETR